MSENNNISDNKLSYLVYESSLMRADKTNVRLWILCIILMALLVATNGLWIYYESQFETVSVEQEAEADNSSYLYMNNGGNQIYGDKSETDN